MAVYKSGKAVGRLMCQYWHAIGDADGHHDGRLARRQRSIPVRMMNTFPLLGLCTGQVAPLGPRGVASGIVKHQVHQALMLSSLGLEGDAQGDTIKHGGPEKAVHHYPFEHYGAWREDLGEHDLLMAPGAFGENLSTMRLTEDVVAIGDVFALGAAVVEVSQGRQPCWRLNERFGRKTMSREVQNTGRTGWYYRVLQEGLVKPEDTLILLDRKAPEWTIQRIWKTFYVDTFNLKELKAITELSWLAEGWRSYASRRLESGRVEDWGRRLYGTELASRQ